MNNQFSSYSRMIHHNFHVIPKDYSERCGYCVNEGLVKKEQVDFNSSIKKEQVDLRCIE